MDYYLVRHGETDANRLTRAAFGKNGAPLNSIGEQHAKQLYEKFLALGINLESEHAVASEFLRARQTAKHAGFTHIETNELLNEIKTADPQNALNLVAKGQVPPEAIEAAKAILANPPKQKVWFTHGLVIAALQIVLGTNNFETFIPDFCEIRKFKL